MKERERTDFPLLRIACWSSSTLYLSNYMKKNSTDTRYRTRSPSSVIIQSFCSAKEWIIPSSPDSRPPAGLSINVSPLSFFLPTDEKLIMHHSYIYILYIYILIIFTWWTHPSADSQCVASQWMEFDVDDVGELIKFVTCKIFILLFLPIGIPLLDFV